MSNSYNKRYLFPNGTLINNWYEEEVLRESTGEGRTIPNRHLPKRSFDIQNPLINPNPHDDTFLRILGKSKDDKLTTATFSKVYGSFTYPEKPYMHPTFRDLSANKEFESLSKFQIKNKEDDAAKNDELRINNSTYNSLFVSQPLPKDIGRRLMFTPGMHPIEKNQPDKLFMAQHKMGKFPEIINNVKKENYVDKFIPYNKDKEITFWSMNLDKGNTYHSFLLGNNAFARSSAFTQNIHNTKGQVQYYGNNHNESSSKYIYLNDEDQKFYNSYKNSVLEKDIVNDNDIIQMKKTMIDQCKKKGWIGLRDLKIYLRNVKRHKSEEIDKGEFKFFTAKNGIILTDLDVDNLFKLFDVNKNNKINFIDALNFFRNVNDYRKDLITKFREQLCMKGKIAGKEKYISLNYLEKTANMNFHPEVMKFKKTEPEVTKEYSLNWDSLREDDFITVDNFEQFFFDVSSCVDSDEDFLQILKACGYKESK